MAELADQFDGMTVTASTPDKQIDIEVSWRGEILALAFRPGAYPGYTEGELARQLGRAATVLWARQRRYYRELVDAALDHPAHDDGADLDRHRRDYHARLAELVVEAESADGAIRIRTEGMTRWQVDIARGTLGTLTEPEFVARFAGVLAGMLVRYRARVIALKHEFYAPDLPDALAPWQADRGRSDG